MGGRVIACPVWLLNVRSNSVAYLCKHNPKIPTQSVTRLCYVINIIPMAGFSSTQWSCSKPWSGLFLGWWWEDQLLPPIEFPKCTNPSCLSHTLKGAGNWEETGKQKAPIFHLLKLQSPGISSACFYFHFPLSGAVGFQETVLQHMDYSEVADGYSEVIDLDKVA